MLAPSLRCGADVILDHILDVSPPSGIIRGSVGRARGKGMDKQERMRDRILAEDLLSKAEATFELVGQVARGMPDIKERLGRVEGILLEHSADLTELKQLAGRQLETVAELKAGAHTH